MPAETWENLIGATVEGRYRLRTLTYSGRHQAEFLAETAELQTRGEKLTVTLISAAQDDIDLVRSQLMIASRLEHPNLVRIVSAGEAAVEGRLMLYMASETPDQTLADILASGPLPKEAARGLALHILGALAFLHEQGLAYRGLDPQTTVRVNGRWKLADYGQVCPIGERSPEPPSYDSPYLPPEAKFGLVTAAWDTWSVGVLLREALTGQVTKVRKLPQPFEEVVRGCLEPQPDHRLSLGAIRRILEPEGSKAVDAASAEGAPRSTAASLPVNAPHYPKMPLGGNVWRTLRVMALIALACLAVLIPLSWWKKSGTPMAKNVPPAPIETPAAPARHAPPKPAPAAASPASARASKAQISKADYISSKMNGRRTASGERFDSKALTASTRVFPLGTKVRITNLANSKSVVVRVNDRGRRGHAIGLTERAAQELGITRAGSAEVLLEALVQ